MLLKNPNPPSPAASHMLPMDDSFRRSPFREQSHDGALEIRVIRLSHRLSYHILSCFTPWSSSPTQAALVNKQPLEMLWWTPVNASAILMGPAYMWGTNDWNDMYKKKVDDIITNTFSVICRDVCFLGYPDRVIAESSVIVPLCNY